jgi:hypothetical protein
MYQEKSGIPDLLACPCSFELILVCLFGYAKGCEEKY